MYLCMCMALASSNKQGSPCSFEFKLQPLQFKQAVLEDSVVKILGRLESTADQQ